MTLTLELRRQPWLAHVEATLAAFPGTIPVIKGNGYGLGRRRLAGEVAALGLDELAVGTVHELDLPGPPHDRPRPIVLTPALDEGALASLPEDAVPTVGSLAHVAALRRARWRGEVMVKLASSMRRYGAEPDELAALLDAVDGAGLAVGGYAVHPPLVATGHDNRGDVERWLPHVPPGARLDVSHLDAEAYTGLLADHPDRRWRIRLGTMLWHGAREHLHLVADALDVRPVRAGDRAGYRLVEVPVDGWLVLVGAGSAHGVTPLPAGRSPFHFARRRLALVEPPHQHTSMCVVPIGELCPEVGDAVDVQRPLTTTWVDRIVER